MFINPQTLIEKEIITHPECKTISDWESRKFISPNAIDFTLDSLHVINDYDTFAINEQYKKLRSVKSIDPVKQDGELCWYLESQQTYDGLSDMYVNVPEGMVAWVIIRSTLSRNGLAIQSGLYDSGFSGHIGCSIYNRSGKAVIGKGTRIGQICFATSENYNTYAGGYNHSKGSHWTDK